MKSPPVRDWPTPDLSCTEWNVLVGHCEVDVSILGCIFALEKQKTYKHKALKKLKVHKFYLIKQLHTHKALYRHYIIL